jgi:hypothetical protein
MPACRLCQQDRELRNSHIVPEFLYRELYNDKGHMMGINGLGRKGWKPLQKGISQKLFCEACEQHFNEHCEKPFKRLWIDNPILPSPWPKNEPFAVTVDYAAFKLFHLSVLYRASVSTLPTFAEVSLGPHEEKIRQMILTRNPGFARQYPIMGIVLLDKKTERPTYLVTMPVQTRFEGLRCYSLTYGGVNWWIAVSSHPSTEWLSASVTESGELPLVGMPWTDLGLMRQASLALKRAEA